MDCITVGGRRDPPLPAAQGGARRYFTAVWLVWLLVVAAIAASPRQFTSGVSVVEVYASVTDGRGEPVTGMSEAEFELREDGAVQSISTFAAGRFPLSVALAIDRSFSMAGPHLALAKSAARTFLGELRPQDDSMLIAIGSDAEVLAPLSADRAAQLAALARLDAFGTTGLHDAIVRAIDSVQPAKGRRALILLSDGSDRYSDASAAAALDRARASDVMIYPVAFGDVRPSLFAEMATLTGGRSYQARDAAALMSALRAIARELHEQYLLGYTPTRPLVPGANEWRSISVSVARPGFRVRARDGYLVK
jgi:Ca-activated chloride channel family protein